MVVKAWLSGHILDLRQLAALLAEGDTQVVLEGDEYYLTSNKIDSRPAGSEYWELAPHVLRFVNGIGRVSDPGFQPVSLVGRYSEGDSNHVVVVAETIRIRFHLEADAIVTDASGTEVKSTGSGLSRACQYAQLAIKYSPVDEVLTFIGLGALGWVEMYKIYEVINDHIDGEIYDHGWGISRTQLRSFTASANHPDISGDTGRHARAGGGLPKNSMSEAEARNFIIGMARSWMDAQLDDLA